MTIIVKNAVLSKPLSDDDRYPKIGYRNLFREGTVTVSSETVAGPKENAYDGFTYDFWRSSAGGTQFIAVEVSPADEADYMAVAAHTLAGATIKPQSSVDGTNWDDLAIDFMPADNSPIVWEFDTVLASHFRLLITADQEIAIGAIHVGLKLTMERGLPVGWKPPFLNEDIEYSNTISEGGQIIGRNIKRRGVSCDIVSNPVTWEFARDDWNDFIEVANIWAVFFWWTYETRSEIIYGGMTEKDVSFSHTRFLSVRCKLQGINR
jgi:hypothetical protein